MKPREYCCCAIPIVNAGVYTILVAQLTSALLVGILSVATPSIVGAANPSYAAWILAVVCFVAVAIQILGFIGVAREKNILFRRYVTLHLLITLAAFAIAATWAIMSATRHSTAKSRCLADFFSNGSSDVSSEGETLCEIFPWVDVGIMGGLWVALAIFHLYLYIILSSYATTQRRDHEKYDQLNNDNFPMNSRGDPWESRPSTDMPHSAKGYSHVRQESAASVSDVLAQPQLQPKDSFRQESYPQEYLGRKPSSGVGAYATQPYGSQAQRPPYQGGY